MRVVVTGASGRVGSWTVAELNAHGHDVIAVDRVLPGEKAARRMEVDMSNLGQVYGALEGADAVIHLAAIPNPVSHPPEVVFGNNVISHYNILEAAASRGIKKVATASSISGYGFAWATRRLAPYYLPLDEEHPMIPDEVYGLTKVVGEDVCAMFHRRTGMQAVNLRFGYVAKPDDYAGRIRAMQEEPELGRKDLWSYVDVRDVAAACRLAVERDGLRDEAFIINNPDTCMRTPTLELLRQYWPEIADIRADLPGTTGLYNIGKAERMLGWKPVHNWRMYL